jgi:hypothetical protein
VLSNCLLKLRNAGGAIAVAACLILWLTVWPFWLVRSHYLMEPTGSSSSRS